MQAECQQLEQEREGTLREVVIAPSGRCGQRAAVLRFEALIQAWKTKNTAQPETLWTIEDVARYARCSLRHVTKLRELGLPHRKLGNLVRFSPKTVKVWLGD